MTREGSLRSSPSPGVARWWGEFDLERVIADLVDALLMDPMADELVR